MTVQKSKSARRSHEPDVRKLSTTVANRVDSSGSGVQNMLESSRQNPKPQSSRESNHGDYNSTLHEVLKPKGIEIYSKQTKGPESNDDYSATPASSPPHKFSSLSRQHASSASRRKKNEKSVRRGSNTNDIPSVKGSSMTINASPFANRTDKRIENKRTSEMPPLNVDLVNNIKEKDEARVEEIDTIKGDDTVMMSEQTFKRPTTTTVDEVKDDVSKSPP